MAALAAAAAGGPDDVFTTATTTMARRPAHMHAWRVEGLTLASFTGAAVGDKWNSPPFHACGFEWRLYLAPNGTKEENKGNVGVYCQLLTPHATVQPEEVTLAVGEVWSNSLDITRVFSMRVPRPEGVGVSWGFNKAVTHANLVAGVATHIPGGVLTVTATLRLRGAAAALANPVSLPAPGLSAALGALLTSGQGADVTLLCGGKRLEAHSLLLCARSPVFAAQLAEGPLRADASAVPVPPEITPHTLRRLLHFLYTDELEPVSAEEASHLLNAADHYNVPRLFAICERTLCSALAIDTVATTLTLADQHGATALKHAALRFLVANAVAVMATLGWAHLASARPLLMGEALHTLATGAPPVAPAVQPPEAEGDAGDAGDGAARRVRRRTR
jgi:speckle-type POZ protein